MTEEVRASNRGTSPPGRVATALLDRRWLSLLAELVLIVAGILIALYIDGLVQESKDRESETTYLELLRDDLSLIEAELTEYVEFEQSILAVGKTFLDAISTEEISENPRPLQGMLGEMSIRRTLSVVSAAYTDLTSTGNLQIISNPGLRRHLVQYFAGIERSELVVEKNSKQYIDEIFVRFLVSAGVTINADRSSLTPITDATARPSSTRPGSATTRAAASTSASTTARSPSAAPSARATSRPPGSGSPPPSTAEPGSLSAGLHPSPPQHRVPVRPLTGRPPLRRRASPRCLCRTRWPDRW